MRGWTAVTAQAGEMSPMTLDLGGGTPQTPG
jgi:hypothetical protein